MGAEQNTVNNFLSGGGEMGRLIREYNWADSELGPPDKWPLSLLTSVSTILNSRSPMLLWWGKNLIQFYNDAYRPSLGLSGKHPTALGQKGIDCWKEVWPEISPLIDQVLNKGEATWSEDQLLPIYRNGILEDIYWTFGYSPLRNDNGNINGVLVICNETTEKRQALETLKESKQQLMFAIDAAELATWELNPETFKFTCNDRLKEWFGLQPADQVDLADALASIAENDRQRVSAEIEKALRFESGGNYDITYTLITPGTKKERIVKAKGKALFLENKMPYSFNGTLQDITIESHVNAIVQTSEANFRNFIMQAPVALCILRGPAFIVEIANEKILEIWGKSNSQVINKPIFEGLHEAKGQGLEEMLAHVYATGEHFMVNERVIDLPRKGKIEKTFVNFIYEAIREIDGSISGVMVVALEVTDQVLARNIIEQSQQELSELTDSLPQLIWKTDRNGKQTFASKRWLDYTGLDPEDENSFRKMVHPDDIERVINIWNRSLSSDKTYKTELRLRNRDGNFSWHQVHGEPAYNADGSIKEWIGAFMDIHDQKMAENELKRFKYMADHASDAFILIREDSTLAYFNDKALADWDYEKHEIKELKLSDIDAQYSREEFSRIFKMAQTSSVPKFESIHKRKNGTTYPVEINPGYLMLDNTPYLFAVMRDMTENKKILQQLEESEKRFKTVADTAPVLIWLAGSDKLFNFVNSAWLNFTGRTMAQETGNGWAEGVHPEDLQRCLDIYAGHFDKRTEFYMEYRLKRHDGQYRWISDSGVPRYTPGGQFEGYIGACMDINDQKSFSEELELKVEERTGELRKAISEVMKSNEQLEQFAYVSSHDLQEPLRKIQTFSGMLADNHMLDDRSRNYLDKISYSAKRMSDLIKDLLTYSRLSKTEMMVPVDLSDVLEKIKIDFEILVNEKKATIINTPLPVIHAIPIQVNQLFYNLISNSLKFSDKNPLIQISSRVLSKHEVQSNPNLNKTTDYIHLSFTDNGIGFLQEHTEKMFIMFQRLNAKDKYSGTGIGLAICKKIVDNHNGFISVESEPGKGATFNIYLPNNHRS